MTQSALKLIPLQADSGHKELRTLSWIKNINHPPLMPITGLTLPLVSYGGSSLLATSVAIGLLINVAQRPGYEIGPDPFRFAPAGA